MDEVLAVVMILSGGLFVGGATTITVERVPAWRRSGITEFRTDFASTLRRVDRLQPALLSISLVSTIGFAITASGSARALAMFAAGGSLLILIGSVTWLVPIQRTLASSADIPAEVAGRLRTRWLRGHLVRTISGVALFVVIVVATTI
jgi:Domain of unknown function (DUF1772)